MYTYIYAYMYICIYVYIYIYIYPLRSVETAGSIFMGIGRIMDLLLKPKDIFGGPSANLPSPSD